MFSTLSDKLTGVLRNLSTRGVLTQEHIKEGLREIRRVLLEAAVSYELTRSFVPHVREKAVGLGVRGAVRSGPQARRFGHGGVAMPVWSWGSREAPITR